LADDLPVMLGLSTVASSAIAAGEPNKVSRQQLAKSGH
jgi:hypothetical protein